MDMEEPPPLPLSSVHSADPHVNTDLDHCELLFQGAEAKIYKGMLLHRPVIIKQRLSKPYRVKELDQRLLRQRLAHV
jgi:hypothetical protein